MQQNNKRLLAVYGTLKKGLWNHQLMGDCEHIGNHEVRGVMTNIMGYPYLFEEGAIEDGEHDLDYDVEVYSVDEENALRIDRMECGAGYEVGQLDTPYGLATIYYMPTDYYTVEKHIISKYPVKS